ncbi:MAG: SPASM domain-containing protein, partial [Firmicutes bacterium]|nr:SPASM domain-containing protein [Bacillota bacterium]
CLYKRLSGCGAGYEYLAVAPNGDLYPCHQFVGQDEFRIGTIKDGLTNTKLSNTYKDSHVLNKPKCRSCWAKYYCSGGCHANNLKYAGSFLEPFEVTCVMERKRLECAFYIQASLAE